MIEFEVTKQDGAARCGTLKTAHGIIETPVFMPVGTDGSVKAMEPENVAATGAKIILGNVYHLMLQPGYELVEKMGGLHKFMNWNKAILTDSGGFQVMSLGPLREIDEHGVKFRSHKDNATVYDLTPEKSIQIQHALDADITMALDECLELPASYETIEKSMMLSVRWAERSLKTFKDREGYGIFGILQGGDDWTLRKKCCDIMSQMPFDGFGLGGVWLNVLFETIDRSLPYLPENKPRYLMGIGIPADIVGGVLHGIDMFDCVLPSRFGRTGQAFLRNGGTLNMRKSFLKDDKRPIEEGCPCPACTRYSRSFVHYLIKENAILGAMLLTWHNIQMYQDMMKNMRAAIAKGQMTDFADDFFARFAAECPNDYAKFTSVNRTIALRK